MSSSSHDTPPDHHGRSPDRTDDGDPADDAAHVAEELQDYIEEVRRVVEPD